MLETKKSWARFILVLGMMFGFFGMALSMYKTPTFLFFHKGILDFFFFAWVGSLLLFSDLFKGGGLKWIPLMLCLFLWYVLSVILRDVQGIFNLAMVYLWGLYFFYFFYQMTVSIFSQKEAAHSVDEGRFIYEASICFFLPLFIYFSIILFHLESPLVPVVWDQFLLAMEGALGYPSLMMARIYQALPFLIKTSVDFIYLSLPFVFFVIYQGQKKKTQQLPFDFLFEFITIAMLGVILYNLVPACGSHAAFYGSWPDFLPLSFLQAGPKWITPPDIFPRSGFPSLHIAWLCCLLRRALLCDQSIKIMIAFFFTGTIVAVFGIGAHYLVDIVVGLCVANVMGGCFSWGLPVFPMRIQAVVCGSVMLIGWYVLIFNGVTWFVSSMFILSGLVSLLIEYGLIKALRTAEEDRSSKLKDTVLGTV